MSTAPGRPGASSAAEGVPGNRLRCRLPLPAGFRAADVLAFHRRDPQQIAERIQDAGPEPGLDKAFVWAGRAACVTIRFEAAALGNGITEPSQVRAECVIDGASGAADGYGDAVQADFERLARHMLGLAQPVEAFERAHAAHPLLGPLIRRNAGLRVPQAATPFEAISWAILGQQISLSAAVALRRRLIQAVGRRHSSGLLCYPDATSLLQVDAAALRAAGCSQAKADALLGLARAVADGRLPLDEWLRTLPVDDIRAGLLAIRGIGPWTINYALLRGFGSLDGSLHGDVAVRRGLQRLLGRAEPVGEAETRQWLEAFAPWRALVAAHLWTVKAEG
ncbi:DNA-3-methyladenine glycosylase 2 [Thauera linaloolentis]|uniref:DNA-3-methyladenine glycosylase II n=1 Tax=Thauera linaloolentis (strain DSM 12138 / JCM 21573 / CCUG 41526 / CIP 105981 / IAM 15112 / NBRC 102519 / 47Lol) TaxID=1123367 RepID=N6Z5C8_THAL4|nr:DNA-3-methyladenine glycosylase [Thauera linaloolentis]ENO87349.1 HhH-GPD [Thauera linaloolentis 47Lol = DSM 12138]MCM8565463.1 DNA-3-methyladenine glycosylase [Thauera linaloolentis]